MPYGDSVYHDGNKLLGVENYPKTKNIYSKENCTFAKKQRNKKDV